MRRGFGLAVLVVLLVAASAAAGVSVGISIQAIPGIWVGTGWTWLPHPPPAPDVAVVRIGVRPWWTRLELDGRFIGIADDFDGVPDYLYLRPGTYRLACILGGYETQVVEIVAKAGYRYDIDFRLKRVKGTKKEHFWQKPHRPKPLPRLYGPVKGQGAPESASGQAGRPGNGTAPPRGTGPDLSLRPDLAPGTAGGADRKADSSKAEMGRVVLRVDPPGAAVYLDGEFLATGRELRQLVEPLAVSPGRHVVEIVAPGLPGVRREFDAAPGETVTLELHASGAGGSAGTP